MPTPDTSNGMSPCSGKSRILIVEDEQHLAMGLRFNLEAEGYHVSVAKDGPQALAYFQNKVPRDLDLVILDVMLPRMSGYAVCQEIRQMGNRIPVLMLTARNLPEDRTRGFEVGTDQYLSKPFDLEELLARVRNLLSRNGQVDESCHEDTGQVADPLFSFGDAQVNFNTFEATVDNQSIHLTALEMKLLRYFVSHAGRVLSRQELLEEVWNLSGTLQTRVPDQFIRRLRKHFEKDPSRPKHFLTIRDAGYRFVRQSELE
jgi:two-component system OmpR family response regulator